MNIRKAAAAIFTLAALISAPSITTPVQRQQPPEYNEVVAASRMTDAAVRLKEFERIKAAYPSSALMNVIDQYIWTANVELAKTLDDVLKLQGEAAAKAQGPQRLQNPLMFAEQILDHPALPTFDKAKVTAAVLKFRDDASKTFADPEALKSIPQEQQKLFKTYFVTGLDVLVARARLNAGDPEKAWTALETYRRDGGAADAQYSYVLGAVNARLGNMKDAYDAYLSAAVENYEDAAAKAKEIYFKLNGKNEGFEAALQAKLKELPFHPEPFKAPAGWAGKTVLAELFTGSECPPCVGADLGFDGLIESYPVQYLAVLEYHLPIPRPDPMMNPATKNRQDYYGVNSTPTVVIDGEKKMIGGGSRGMAEGKFKEYKTEIDARLAGAPAVGLKVRASRSGERINVACELEKSIAGAEVRVVLVQGEEIYKGSNGLQFHKLVVRDIALLPPGADKAAFDLASSEQAADAYLTDFEKTSTRFPNFKFPERHAKIDRAKLKVVLFAQDKDSKKVLNAAVADVQ